MKMQVLLEITVPEGDFCWNFHDQLCDHFDNEGGFNQCDLRLGELGTDSKGAGVRKPLRCKELLKARVTK